MGLEDTLTRPGNDATVMLTAAEVQAARKRSRCAAVIITRRLDLQQSVVFIDRGLHTFKADDVVCASVVILYFKRLIGIGD